MKINKMKYVIIMMLGLLLLGCNKKEQKEEIVRPVVIMDLAEQGNASTMEFPGLVVANNDTVLAFKIPGSIAKINVLPGDPVKKGQIIATLDKSDYMVNLEANTKQYDAAKAGYDNMVQQYKRAVILHDGKAMSDKNFDIITAQYKASLATLKAAEQGVKNAKNRVEDTMLKAPYDGYIGKRILDEGSVVSAATPVVSVVSKGKLRVDINVAGKDISNIEAADSYNFKINEKSYTLKLIKVGKNTDLLKLTYPVTFEFIEDDPELRVGSSGSVVVGIKGDNQSEIMVPVSALFEKDGSNVYLYKDGTVQAQKVELGSLKTGGNVTILKGLTKNDKVVIAGVNTISEGEKVKVLEKPSSTNAGGVL